MNESKEKKNKLNPVRVTFEHERLVEDNETKRCHCLTEHHSTELQGKTVYQRQIIN